MVRVRLLVRIIPEDVYLADVQSATPSSDRTPLRREQRLLHVVHDPEHVYIKLLEDRIEPSFQRMNKGHALGKIKYLKYGQIDADLDPEMSIYDALVDAGTAATAPADQTATIKMIREVKGLHFDVREGSVVFQNPDVARLQPSARPPVPHFEEPSQSTSKRSMEQAFAGESTTCGTSHNAVSPKRQRHGVAKDDAPSAAVVHSIERDLSAPPRQASHRSLESPIIVPETQSSPLQAGVSSQKGGSVILGDHGPKSESPEINDSVHSLPIAEEATVDPEILENFPSVQSPSTAEPMIRDNSQARTGAENAQPSTTASSSTYFSLPSTGKGRSLRRDSATDLFEEPTTTNSAVQEQSRVTNGSDHGGDLLDEGNEITPPSDSLQQCDGKAAKQSPTPSTHHTAAPPSGFSSPSSKFRRHDGERSPNLDIQDTQMSRRSQKSLKRKQQEIHSATALNSAIAREVSWLFDTSSDKQPLIQNGKRPRKETEYDFSNHIEGMSDPDDGGMDYRKVQRPVEDGDTSEYEEPRVTKSRRSKSHALSESTNKESNASTERPAVTSASTELLARSRAGNRRLLRNETDPGQPAAAVATAAPGDSDKENNNDQQAMNSSAPLQRGRDVVEEKRTSSQRPSNSAGRHENGINTGFETSDDIIEISNDTDFANSNMPAEATLSKNKRTPTQVWRSSLSSEEIDAASQNTQQLDKQTAYVGKQGDVSKQTFQQSEHCPPTRPVTSDGVDKVEARMRGSRFGCTPTQAQLSPAEPDEQLSQDLQASAQAASHTSSFVAKKGGGSTRKRDAAKRNTVRPGKREMSRSEITAEGEENLAIRKPSDSQRNQSQNAGISAASQKGSHIDEWGRRAKSDASVPGIHSKTPQDGKIGLGFSQSPTEKQIASRLHSYGDLDSSDLEGGDDSAASMPNRGQKSNFLKKSKSFERLVSSQSLSIDTPSRTGRPEPKVQARAERVVVEIPSPEPDAFTRKDLHGGASVQPVAGRAASEPESDRAKDPSTGPNGVTAKEAATSLETDHKSALAGAATSRTKTSAKSSGLKSHPPLRQLSRSAVKAAKPDQKALGDASKDHRVCDTKGSSIIMPPGFTQEKYLAARANLEKQPPKSKSQLQFSSNKSTRPAEDHTYTAERAVSATTLVSTKQAITTNGTPAQNSAKKVLKAADSTKPFSADKGNMEAVKQRSKPSTKLSVMTTGGAAAANVDKKKEATPSSQSRPYEPAPAHPKENPSVSPVVKGDDRSSTIKEDRSSSTRVLTNGHRTGLDATRPRPSMPGMGPSPLERLRTQREAEKAKKERAAAAAAASCSKDSAAPPASRTGTGTGTGKPFLFGTDESESETESDSSDDDGLFETLNGVSKGELKIRKQLQSELRPEDDPTIRDRSPSDDGDYE